ncbi:COG4223 family protein [Kordiimonas aquimaris]|uniref:COG4223 family protein n=1 Tax=Kordiimonas aquimaris TaxID=707591 RepID=UPI0021D14694|nr:hypothetical protein [Kordiimonas aquimaris]
MTAKKNDEDRVENGDVIDAEIIAEQEAEVPKDNMKAVEATPQVTKGGKAGWITALILLAFIGGIFAAPHARRALVDAGILQPRTGQSDGLDAEAYRQELANLEQQIAAGEQRFVRHQEMIAQLLERADAAVSAQTKLEQDIALVAGQGVGPTSGQATNDEITALKAEISRLSNETARLATLAGTASPEVSVVNGRLALAQAETSQLKSQVAAMEVVIAGLQAGALDTTPRGRLLVVLGRLKGQAQSGLSFDAELNSLQLDLASLPALDQQLVGADFAILNNNADGVLSFQELSKRFNETARGIKLAQEKAEGGFLANLFTVRRTDDNATGIDAALLDAERRLVVRDVTGAIQTLSALEGAAKEAAAQWIIEAQAHADTLAALDRTLRTIAGRSTFSTTGDQE